MNFDEVLIVLAVLAVAVGSAAVFRRFSLGTRSRGVLSLVAVGLLGFQIVRERGWSVEAVGLIGLAVLTLGYSVYYLRRVEETPPSVEE